MGPLAPGASAPQRLLAGRGDPVGVGLEAGVEPAAARGDAPAQPPRVLGAGGADVLHLLARPGELLGARRRQLGLVRLEAGQDAPPAGPDALAELPYIRLAPLVDLAGALLGLGQVLPAGRGE